MVDWLDSWRRLVVCWTTSSRSWDASKSWAVANASSASTLKSTNRISNNGKSRKSRYLASISRDPMTICIEKLDRETRNRNGRSSTRVLLRAVTKRNWKCSSTSARTLFLRCSTPAPWWLLRRKEQRPRLDRLLTSFLSTTKTSISPPTSLSIILPLIYSNANNFSQLDHFITFDWCKWSSIQHPVLSSIQ